MRKNLLTFTIATSLATLALAGCGRDADPSGAYVTGTQQSTAQATIEPAVEPTPTPAPATEPAPVLEYADVTRVRAVNDSSPIYLQHKARRGPTFRESLLMGAMNRVP